MGTVNDFVPVSTRASKFSQPYSIDERQTQPYQPWKPNTSSTNSVSNTEKNKNTSGSCKKHLTTKLLTSILVGFVVCGIPLAVISSLYVQKNTSSNSSTGNSGTSGNSSSLPSQCSSYVTNADSTRNVGNTACSNCISDTSPYLSTGWYRFTDGAGTQLVTFPPSMYACGVTYPGWFNGSLPTTAGATTSGLLCISYSGIVCYTSWSAASVSATNCSGFYVFYLTPLLAGSTRYCTT